MAPVQYRCAVVITLTGTYARADGSPAAGSVSVRPYTGAYLASAHRTYVASWITEKLDPDHGTVLIQVDIDHTAVTPQPFWLEVREYIDGCEHVWAFDPDTAPATGTPDLWDIGRIRPTPGTGTPPISYSPVPGPTGPAGPAGPQGPAGPPAVVDPAAIVTDPAAQTALDGRYAQITAYDDTTGQLQIAGQEVGDTGLRDVSADLTNGFAGTLLLRREGNTVRLVTLDLTGPSTGIAYTLTPGFIPSTAATAFILANTTSTSGQSPVTVAKLFITSNGSVRTPATSAIQGEISFLTSDPWPTALPGAAA